MPLRKHCSARERLACLVMDPALLVAVISLIISVVFGVVSARTSWLSARAAQRSAVSAEKSQEVSARQLEATVTAQESALQPYVWADLKPREDGAMLVLVVGNAGPTVATDVKVGFAPLLSSIVPANERVDAERIEQHLAHGLSSITPGRTFLWNLGVAHEFFTGDGRVPDVRITVTGAGPRGPLEPLTYSLALEDLKHQADRAVGIYVLERPLRDLNTTLKRVVAKPTPPRRLT